MPILTTDFSSLTDDLQSIFNETAKAKVSENVGFQIYNVVDTSRLTHDHLILHGIAGVKKITEGEDFPKVTSEEGDNVTYTQAQYGIQVDVTKKMRKFDLYTQIESLVKSVADDAFDKIDQSLADRILGGFGATYTDPYGDSQSGNGPDAVTLFSSAHTNNLTSNQEGNLVTDSAGTTNPALSRDAIVWTRALGLQHQDPHNLIRPIHLDTLIVSPKNEDLARRIIESEGMSGTANNDSNPLRGRMNLIVWPRLNINSAGTDTSDYWFMYDSQKVGETLKVLFSERPSLDAPEVVYSNKNWEYTLDYFYTLGTGYPLYIWGTTGAGS